MSDLNQLYSPVIKAHQSDPYHFEKVSDAGHCIKSVNPVCGDRFTFYADIRERKMASMHFHGFGCAVAKASGSVLVKTLEGKTIVECIRLCDAFISLLEHGSSALPLPEDCLAFLPVREFPARYECAAQAWREVGKFLRSTTSGIQGS